MEIGLDTNLWANLAPVKPAGDAPAHPDWHGLRSRLYAARAAHRAIAGCWLDDGDPAIGSFDASVAVAVLAHRAAMDFVNPSSLGDRKPGADKDAGVAGESSTGDRG